MCLPLPAGEGGGPALLSSHLLASLPSEDKIDTGLPDSFLGRPATVVIKDFSARIGSGGGSNLRDQAGFGSLSFAEGIRFSELRVDNIECPT